MDQNQDEPKSLLTNLRQHHIVQVHNPLSENPSAKLKGDFTWTVARSVTQLDARNRDPYIDQLNMRNNSHPTMKHVTQSITIPCGATMKLPGDVAQIIVKHLVDEILMRQGNKSTLGDPTLRREIEEMVILNVNDLRSQMSTLNIEEQLEQQIRDLNKDDTIERAKDAAETAFPELNQASGSQTLTTQPGSTAEGDQSLGADEASPTSFIKQSKDKVSNKRNSAPAAV